MHDNHQKLQLHPPEFLRTSGALITTAQIPQLAQELWHQICPQECPHLIPHTGKKKS